MHCREPFLSGAPMHVLVHPRVYRAHRLKSAGLVDLTRWFSKYEWKLNKGGEVSKYGSRRGDPNRGCVFLTLPLHVCVQHGYFRKE